MSENTGVRDAPEGVEQVREVFGHLVHQRPLSFVREAQHREVGVPVVELGESPARHDVGMRERKQRASRRVQCGFTAQHRPQRVDVVQDRLARNGFPVAGNRLRQLEVAAHELGQVEPRLPANGEVRLQDGGRIALWRAVDERLAIREHPLALDGDEQFTVTVSRGAVVARGMAGRSQSSLLGGSSPRGHCSW
jgi:hypothetical protein